MKKGQQSFIALPLALLVFSLFITGFWFSYTAIAESYDVTVNESFAEPFDKALETKNLTEDLAARVSSPEATVTDTLISFAQTGFTSLPLLFNAVGIAQSLVLTVSTFLGIPSFVVVIVISLINLFIVGLIIRALINS